MTQRSYSGRFRPSYPGKYKGDPTNIIYRSLWERKLMVWCDKNENVLEWGSEEIIIPYVSPIDNRIHRYFPDFYIKGRTSSGTTKYIVEVKPKAQTLPPKKGRKTKRLLNEIATYGVNQAKWKAAREYCADRKMKFMILTEKELKV
jgi:hypothetical protein